MARDTTLELDCGNACDVGHNTRRVKGYTTLGLDCRNATWGLNAFEL